MGLFDFFKKSETFSTTQTSSKKGEVWRNSLGEIYCPGDSCPKDCDDTCPIYLNTQALALMRINQSAKAIPLYEEALHIAPDFYDAWNNIAGIYGQLGNYQKAYECYKKAHEINAVKPNPVFGLMLSSLDLGKCEESLSWCDLYKTLSSDGRDIPVRKEANRRMGNEPEERKTNRF